RLVAWIVPKALPEGDTAPEAQDLRTWLAASLPFYMLPAAFVVLAALPVTPNGKLDREALPAPELALAAEYVAPSGPEEEMLAALWAELLGAERVGARDNFFTLGGHSLLGTRVISRLREAFEVEVPLRDLFEAPVLSDLAARIEILRRAPQAGADEAPPAAPPLVPVDSELRAGPLPLSFAQQRLWFIDQLEPGNPVYNLFNAVRLLGPAGEVFFPARFAAVIRRHETLRTTFAQHGGEPVQIVHPWLAPEIASIDLTSLTSLAPAARDREVRRLAEAEMLRPFDLARGPLARAHFLTLGPEESAALFTLHHIVGDEWSMRLLIEELGGARPELPVQYADFAAWQRGWLQGETLEAELRFWRTHLAGAPELLALPTDRPRPAVQTFRGTSSARLLPAELTEALHAAGRAHPATPFMLYLTAFQALLGRLSGEPEIVIGTPFAGRNRLETERLIGFFVNTLVLRGSLAGRPTLGGLLDRARETVLAAHAHQDLPFELLVEDLNPRRSLSHTPLFQVMLNLATAAPPLELPGLTLAPLTPLGGVRSGIAPFDLTLSIAGGVAAAGEGTRIVIEYSTDLFDAATIERFHGYLREVLRALATAPGTGCHEIDLWTPAERHQVLTEWNDAVAAPLAATSLHGLFADQVRQRPDAPAVFFAGGSWSFAELAAKSGALARHLRRQGVGPEVVAGISAAGGPELVVGILGILQAGGAFLPLDPSWPAERRAALLADAGARLITAAPEGIGGQNGHRRLDSLSPVQAA